MLRWLRSLHQGPLLHMDKGAVEEEVAMEEVVVVLARAAAGTMSPATKTPQIALTPRKRTNLPSVVAVSKMGCFFAAIFPVYRQGLRFEV